MCVAIVQYSTVVASCDVVGTKRLCILQKWAKLDFAVAKHVGVGGATAFVLIQKVAKNAILVLLGKVNGVVWYAKFVGNALYVFEILLGSTTTVFVVLFPVVHKQCYYVVTLLLK